MSSSNTRIVPVQIQHQQSAQQQQQQQQQQQHQRDLQRKGSVDEFGEKVVNMLDEIERRVEQLREHASLLEQEKESLLEMLSAFSLNTDMIRLGQGDREDIAATANRLLSRCRTVDVVVNTPRNPEQAKALNQVNTAIESLVVKMQEDLDSSKEMCKRYLNATSPEDAGPIDQRFQTLLIECTAEDQKKIRRRLATVIASIERAQRTCVPSF